MDCGPTCLKMIARHFHKDFSPDQIENIAELRKNGASLLDLCVAARKTGLNAAGLEINLTMLKRVSLPVILHWNLNHFVVLFKIKGKLYYIADPAIGVIKISESDLLKNWYTSSCGNIKKRIVLLFSEGRDFHMK